MNLSKYKKLAHELDIVLHRLKSCQPEYKDELLGRMVGLGRRLRVLNAEAAEHLVKKEG